MTVCGCGTFLCWLDSTLHRLRLTSRLICRWHDDQMWKP